MRQLFLVLSIFGLLLAPAANAEEGSVVIELYTSQGCSSCPPADEMLYDLAKRDGVIALALHVDYWDYLGWKDGFARPQFTSRQHGYAQAARATTVYTPQMVINGQDMVVGSRAMQVMDALENHRGHVMPVSVSLSRRGDVLRIVAETEAYGDFIVQMVRYLPEATVDVRHGENAGRTLTYSNIVTSWEAISRWDGRAPFAMEIEVAGDSPVVVLVQHRGFGPIVGAAQLR